MTDGPELTSFPDGFFDRCDPSPDADFYGSARLVTHLDDIAAVGELYAELGVDGSVPARQVLDLMSSWVSHLSLPRPSWSCSA